MAEAICNKHILVVGLLNNLAEVYRTEGKYQQANELHQQVLTLRKDVLEPDHPDIALSLNNLAGLAHVMGNYEQAEDLVKQAFSNRERQRGPNHPEVAVSLNDLAELYPELRGVNTLCLHPRVLPTKTS